MILPKTLGNVRERITSAAKEELLAKNGFSLRAVAEKCGIATGTVYNYFPDKETITASVMAEDWRVALSDMDAAAACAVGFKEGAAAVYAALEGYVLRYEAVWRSYKGGSYNKSRRKYHGMLRKSITDRILSLANRFSVEIGEKLLPVVGETMLSCALEDDIGAENFAAFIEMIFNKK